MTDEQLQMELSFGVGRGSCAVSRRQQRLHRAAWWFERMRQIVDRALDWKPAPAARPEQIWFADGKAPARQEERQAQILTREE